MKRIILLLPCLALSGLSHAAIIESASDPALMNGTLVDFNDLAMGEYATLTTKGVTFSINKPGDIQKLIVTDNPYSFSKPYASNLLNYATKAPLPESGQFPNPNPPPPRSLRIDFSTNISALGFMLLGASYPTNLSVYDSSSSLVESYDLPGNLFRNFYVGISSDITNIKYAVLGWGIGEDYMLIDDLVYAPGVSQVPVPAALPLMLSALGVFGIAKRRKQI